MSSDLMRVGAHTNTVLLFLKMYFILIIVPNVTIEKSFQQENKIKHLALLTH